MEKPARYIGGEVGSVIKDEYSLRVALSYPDVYEIGTANQAVQILYSLINGDTDAWAQRVYCPWPDMASLMRQEQVPLFLLESWKSVRNVDLWGITLQYELTYSNILEMLDLAGVPLHRDQRSDDHPLIFGGGPCASNPHPMADFFDFLIIGDGEAVVPEVVRICEEGRDWQRGRVLEALANLEGIYVPGSGARVTRAVAPRMLWRNLPLRPIIPTMHAVHDRATLEIKRGCTRGCRFCLAGNWYRPVRERRVDDIVRAVEEVVDNTGYDEVSLSSLSATDHSGIKEIIKALAQSKPGLKISLPSLRVDPDSIRLLEMVPSRKGSITMAPEAGSQRLRDTINKQVTDEDIDQAAEAVFQLGCTTIKLYFMIGLPAETMEDIEGIIDIALRVRRIGRQTAASKGRVKVNVSVSTFVPKAHTPFQWEGMEGRASLEEKQEYLRRNMPRKQIKLSFHNLDASLVEGAITRGGDEIAAAIEAAWRAGARFDAWTEEFNFSAWEEGFKAISTTVEEAASRSFEPGGALPWDDVDSRVDQEFLLAERDKALRGEITPDCRWDECSLCGVCEGEIELHVGEE